MTREQIRREIRDKRENISIIQSTELSARIAERAIALPEYQRAGCVLSYASLLGEVRTESLNARILADAKTLLLPKVTGSGLMAAARVTDLSTLRPGKMRVPEVENGECFDPEKIDLVFVPGIAFDKEGGRLGFGGGYYDRFLPMAGRALRVGLAFGMQIVPDVCAMEHDQKMDVLITEDNVYDLRR